MRDLRALYQKSARAGDPARRGVPADAGPRPGRAGVPLPGREARPGRGASARLGLGAGEPAQLFPLVVAARRRAAQRSPQPAGCASPRRSSPRRGGCSATQGPAGWPTEFACQWLHIHDFDHLDEKSERHFPTFAGLRGAMYEESIRFFTDLFQNDGSVLDILDADHTFLNEPLAKHYGIPGVDGGPGVATRRRGQGVRPRRHPRAGDDAGQAIGRLADQPDPAGQLVSEVLLGEQLPQPAQGRAALPETKPRPRLTVRQLVEKHSSDAKCAVCHRRIDPFGFALEGFDAIGRRREKDLGDRPIDTRVKAMDGREFDGLDGLRDYLLTARRDAFLRSSAASCWATRSAAPCSFPTSRCWPRCRPS